MFRIQGKVSEKNSINFAKFFTTHSSIIYLDGFYLVLAANFVIWYVTVVYYLKFRSLSNQAIPNITRL